MVRKERIQVFSSSSRIQSFMSALQRLVKIGMFYPSGHSVLKKATGNFQLCLFNLAQEKSGVHFTISEEKLFLENVEINSNHVFVKDLKNMLTLLGIDELEIDREIEAKEIVTFLRKLVNGRN